MMKFLYSLFFLLIFETQCSEAYRKYYVEDECASPNDFQKVFFRLAQTGVDSVGELQSNRFGTYSRTGRNCLIKLIPPKGFGVIVTVLKVDFRNHEGCKDYIKIFDNDDEDDGEKLCGYKKIDLDGKTYFSDGNIRILYHTAEGGMGFSNGFKLIFTVTKLDGNASSCTAPDEFMCKNLHCIWAGVECDGINNCGDGSDEFSSGHSHCSTYQQLYKSFFSRLAEVTPIAIAAVILGVISFIAVLILMCLCCCRPHQPTTNKHNFTQTTQYRPHDGYVPLPGNVYDAVDYGMPYQWPIYSPIAKATAPEYVSSRSQNLTYPNVHQKIDMRYHHRPPPPYIA